jgi:hypothetical protein
MYHLLPPVHLLELLAAVQSYPPVQEDAQAVATARRQHVQVSPLCLQQDLRSMQHRHMQMARYTCAQISADNLQGRLLIGLICKVINKVIFNNQVVEENQWQTSSP